MAATFSLVTAGAPITTMDRVWISGAVAALAGATEISGAVVARVCRLAASGCGLPTKIIDGVVLAANPGVTNDEACAPEMIGAIVAANDSRNVPVRRMRLAPLLVIVIIGRMD